MFKDNRRRDLDNYSATVKMILDGMVAAGVMPDDNREIVQEIKLTSCRGKAEGVTVIIEGEAANG